MRILLVSYFFPPYNAIGAVRVSKTAKYLEAAGHEVRVLSASDQPLPASLPLSISPEYVCYANQFNINAPVDLILGGRRRIVVHGYSEAKGRSPLLAKLGHLYKTLLHIPDHQIGWYPDAVRQGTKVINAWMPDIILASATPYTSLLVAHSLASRFKLPWVAELRDLWTDNHYREFPEWRLRWERKLEKKILSSASGLVTVSEPLADILRQNYSCLTTVVYNGYDPEDYPAATTLTNQRLTIVYTGSLYEGKRDITPLFQALQTIPDVASKVHLKLFGYGHCHTVRMAEQYGLQGAVEDCGMVSYQESLQAQVDADMLLLVLVDDPRDKGVLTGKLFEYLGTGKPIICTGSHDGEAARLIASSDFGFVANTRQELSELLMQYLSYRADKSSRLKTGLYLKYTRSKQTDILQNFLLKIVREHNATNC